MKCSKLVWGNRLVGGGGTQGGKVETSSGALWCKQSVAVCLPESGHQIFSRTRQSPAPDNCHHQTILSTRHLPAPDSQTRHQTLLLLKQRTIPNHCRTPRHQTLGTVDSSFWQKSKCSNSGGKVNAVGQCESQFADKLNTKDASRALKRPVVKARLREKGEE